MAGDIKRIVEALLFVAEEALSASKLAEIAGASPAQVKAAVAELKADYAASGPAFTIEEIADGFRMLTRPEYSVYCGKLFASRRRSTLSPAALETLAIVAYKQPVTRAEIEAVRGVECGELLRNLIAKGLVRVAGRDDSLGRPLLYGTTKNFLEHFGLQSLRDLPKIRELETPNP